MSWVKIIHLLCFMGWMTSVFAVPRALIYWKREYERLGENGPLGDLTFRLYRFSFGLAVIGIITGIWYGSGLAGRPGFISRRHWSLCLHCITCGPGAWSDRPRKAFLTKAIYGCAFSMQSVC